MSQINKTDLMGGGTSTQNSQVNPLIDFVDEKQTVGTESSSAYSLSTSAQTIVGAINEIEKRLGIVSYPENTTDDSSNVIRLGKDSPEVVKKKVFGGVPYVIIEPSETWNSEYYSSLFDEEGFYSWYDNYIADNTAIYKICDVLTVQNGEENGFMINIRVLKPQPSPGPLAAVTGAGVSTDPLDLIDIKCVFATNEESILSYALHLWETTKHVIYTEPPELYPIAAGRGQFSAIIGNLYTNKADGNYSVAEGYSTTASGNYSHAEGYKTTALGDYSHAEGYNCNAAGDYSHAEGLNTTASTYSHAEGWRTEASGSYSHAEGEQTTASGLYSHAEGNDTQATGQSAHAEGEQTTASGHYSHAEGAYTKTFNNFEHAEGHYNVSNSGKTDDLRTRHSVGIGSSFPDIRMNAHEIMANGDHYIYGLGGYDGTNATAETSQTLQAVINSLSTITVDYNQPTTSYTGSDSTTIYKIFDLSSLKYTEGNDIILINGAQRLKYQYAYGETQAATVQVNESTSIEYNLINILSPLITNIFSLEELTIVHGKINAETDEKYYLIIKEAVPTV